MHYSMQLVLERGSIHKPLNFLFGLINSLFTPVCSSNTNTYIHVKCFSIQMFQYFSQIAWKVCTSALSIKMLLKIKFRNIRKRWRAGGRGEGKGEGEGEGEGKGKGEGKGEGEGEGEGKGEGEGCR